MLPCSSYDDMLLLKLVRNRGICFQQLYIVFHALIMSRLMYALPVWGGFVSVERTNRINGYSNDAIDTDMDMLIRFTVCQTYLTQLIWLFLVKCTLRLIVSILCFLQSEINLNICAVGGMTLLYPHIPKIFTRDHSSCVVCLTLCSNHTIVFILLYYRTTQSFSHASSIMFLPISIRFISCTITYAFVMCQ